MNPDKFQQAWNAEATQTRITINADLLKNEVERSHKNFLSTIFLRDLREIGVALLLIPYWFYQGIVSSLPWTWYLSVPAIVWVAGFILVDRRRYPQKPSEPSEPLLECVRKSLSQLEHQIWLLRNVFWWYFLPGTISIQAFFAHVALLSSKDWLGALARATPFFLFLVSMYSFLDYVNQRAVRLTLEPRRKELLKLLADLGEEDSTEPDLTVELKAQSTAKFELLGVLKRWLSVLILSYLVLCVLMVFIETKSYTFNGDPTSSGPRGESLAGLVNNLREEKNLVGLAAMVMIDGQIEAVSTNGERKLGSGIPLENGDRWHLGGITKSITATMIARLVEAGKMEWNDTIGEIFPEDSVHMDWKQVTLKQLLTDSAGVPANFSADVSRKRPNLGSECTQMRLEEVLKVLTDKPVLPPDEKFVYSNVGYSIVGAMAEKVTGATWEDLVKREVFMPLGLEESGFGPPKSSDKMLEQPRGHMTSLLGKTPMKDDADNTAIMGPSGIVHMTLRDLCLYATEHMRGELGNGKLLSAETYRILHAPNLDSYACGWIRKESNSELPFRVFWHNGSNTFWYALVVFIPEKNTAIAVTSNDGDIQNAQAAAWEIVKANAK